MKKKNEISRAAGRCPHEVGALVSALHQAVTRLLYRDASFSEVKEIYAVFEERSACLAIAMLSVGFSRYARITAISAEEKPRKIFLHVTGDRRTADGTLTYRALLPEGEPCLLALDRFLRENCMAWTLSDEDGKLTLSISLPRFLADEYDAGAIDADDVRDHFYDAMLFLSGEKPKHPMP